MGLTSALIAADFFEECLLLDLPVEHGVASALLGGGLATGETAVAVGMSACLTSNEWIVLLERRYR